MNLYTVLIQKDTYSLVPDTVTENEIPILQELHGASNVKNAKGNPVDDDGLGSPVKTFEPQDEFARLCNRYGADVVQQIYGTRGNGLKKTSRRKTATAPTE